VFAFVMVAGCLCFSMLFGAVGEATAEDHAYRISAATGPYFLCDERVVEDRWLVERFVVPPRKYSGNPLIVREFPWEGSGPHLGGSVLYDASSSLFRMWYSVFDSNAYKNKLPFSYNVCYAESQDGIQWRKPSLGVFDYHGSQDNNCIRLGEDKTQNIDVCLNPSPDRFPGRFLAMHNQKGGVFLSSSEDGKTFTRLYPAPAISYHSDTQNNFVYDEIRDRWLLFCRPRAYAGYHKRRISLTISQDFEHWPHERTILIPSETEIPEYYGMTVFRRGDLFFGMIYLYDKDTGFIHPELAWSGDGEDWDKIPTHPPFVERGSEGAWDAGMIFLANEPVVHGNELWFYYGGFALEHNTDRENPASIGLLISDLDRLIGLRSMSSEPGRVLTRPFLVENRRIFVNTRVDGRLRAEIRTDGNKVIEGWSLEDCDPLIRSGFRQEITWKGRSLTALGESEIRLLFELERSELFTFEVSR
jgi:hypothetical protein